MLRMYLVQSWFNLSDAMVEDAIYDSYTIRSFMGLNFHDEQAPDATTLLKFRRLLEEQKLGKKMFEAIGQLLESKGCTFFTGSFVQALIILLREGLEAILVVAVIIAYLIKAGMKDRVKHIYAGIVLGLVGSGIVAVLFAFLYNSASAHQVKRNDHCK